MLKTEKPALTAIFLVTVTACGPMDSTEVEIDTTDSTFEATSKTQLSLNDVSVMFPVTAPRFFERALKISDVGAQGAMVPSWVFSQAVGVDSESFDGAILRAVSVRFDPCANVITAKDDASCERQIRIVWQGIRVENGRLNQVLDFNLHSIYRVENSAFKSAIAKLRTLKASTKLDYSKQPLKPHPAIVAQGMDGNYAKTVLGIVKSSVGEKNLVEVAFMQEVLLGSDWVFTAFDVNKGQAVHANLPTLDQESQTLNILQTPPFDIITPVSSSADELSFVQGRLSGDKTLFTEGEAQRAIASSFRIENPKLHNPKTIDCASCHLAPVTRSTLASMGFAAKPGPDTFTSKNWKLEASAEKVNNEALQNFAYRAGGQFVPSIRPRVVNDSAVSADWVNLNLK